MKGYKYKTKGFLFAVMIAMLAAWGIPKSVSAAEWIHQDGTIYCVTGNNVEMTYTELEQLKSEGSLELNILQRSQVTIRILGTMEIYEGGFGWIDLTELESTYMDPETGYLVVPVDMYVNADAPEEGGIQIMVTVINEYEPPEDEGGSSEPISPSPDDPEKPEAPDDPEEPVVPEEPLKPEKPEESESPQGPEDLEEPSLPELPAEQQKPQAPQKPSDIEEQDAESKSEPVTQGEMEEQTFDLSVFIIPDNTDELWEFVEVDKPLEDLEKQFLLREPEKRLENINSNTEIKSERQSIQASAARTMRLVDTNKVEKSDVVLSGVCGLTFLLYGSVLYSDARLIWWFYKRKKQNIRIGIGEKE